jgi:enoyl-CoA hydratase/carnithine racemase
MSNTILYEEHNGVGVLRVNRPEARNALNWEAQQGFVRAITTAAESRALRVLIITGAGSTFVAGGDLKELAEELTPEAGVRLNRVMSEALEQLTQLPLPVIAAVNGDAAGGGCEIIAACDLRLAAEDAQLRWVQVRMGLTTGWGGTARLVRLIGASRAMALLLTGESISATEAYRIGLVHRLAPQSQEVLPAAIAWAERLAALPRDALAATKELVRRAALSGEVAASVEPELFAALWGGANHREAVSAFVEKRSAHFDR